jgi:hypothetical protein
MALVEAKGWNQLGSAIVDDNNNNPTQLLLVKERTGGPFPYHAPPLLFHLFCLPLPFIILYLQSQLEKGKIQPLLLPPPLPKSKQRQPFQVHLLAILVFFFCLYMRREKIKS